MLKDRALARQPGEKLNAGQHLLASGQAGKNSSFEAEQNELTISWLQSEGVASALATAPIWVVKTRMFTSRKADSQAYRNVFGEGPHHKIHLSIVG